MTSSVLKVLHRKHDERSARECAGATATSLISSSNARAQNETQYSTSSSSQIPTRGGSTSIFTSSAPRLPDTCTCQSSDSSGSASSSTLSTPAGSPALSASLPGPAIIVSNATLVETGQQNQKKKHSFTLRHKSQSRSADRKASPSVSAERPATTPSIPMAAPVASFPGPIQRFPSRIEHRHQYDRHGRLLRAFEELFDHDATMPCLGYGTPPGPVGSEAFGRPPPYA